MVTGYGLYRRGIVMADKTIKSSAESLARASVAINGEVVDDAAYKGRLLTHHYRRRAESSIGEGSRYIMTKAYFGTSDLVTKNPAGGWMVDDIPLDFDLTDLNTNFSESGLMASVPVDSTSILMAIHLDDQSLQSGVMYDFNTLVLVDNEGKAFAVLCIQQETLYKGRSFSAYLTIEQETA